MLTRRTSCECLVVQSYSVPSVIKTYRHRSLKGSGFEAVASFSNVRNVYTVNR